MDAEQAITALAELALGEGSPSTHVQIAAFIHRQDRRLAQAEQQVGLLNDLVRGLEERLARHE